MTKVWRTLHTVQQMLVGSIVFSLFIFLHAFLSIRGLPQLYFSLVNVPTISYFILYCLSQKRWLSWKIADGISIVLAPLFVIFVMVSLFVGSFDVAIQSITDPLLYNKVMSQYRMVKRDEVSHFPREIDLTTDVWFHEHPKILQGGNELMLGMVINDIQLANEQTYFEKDALWIVRAYDAKEFEHNSLPCITCYLPIKLTDDAVFYVLYQMPYRENDYNHGESYGALIDEEINVIVYYYSYW